MEGGKEHAREVETGTQDVLTRVKRSRWPRSQIYETYAKRSCTCAPSYGNQHQGEANIDNRSG